MKKARLSVFFGALLMSAAVVAALIGPAPGADDNGPAEQLIAGRNVNMVSGTRLPDGDPWLQRQNEPSMAVSTRNPLHLLAGANDYRTVDVPFSEGELPGLANAAAGDAWLGIFKSFDGGATWKTSLLPGFPQDRSPEGMASPLKKFSTAADPIVRAGTNGLFYYSGMAFNRAQQRGGGSLFVARFIDNNDVEGGDSIKYLDTRIIVEGDAGNFIDMPRIAVDAPRGAGTVTIDGQAIPRSNVYAAYTVFVGDSNVAIRSQIWFRRSTDCGQTWGPAVKITDAQHIVQGAAIAIDPNSGAVYVAYRRFQHAVRPNAVVIVRSTDYGQTFSEPVAIAPINPFDQPTTEDWIAPPVGASFRTNSYPTMTVDDDGIVYVAWAERGWGPAQEARIVLYTSRGGASWVGPRFVDNGPKTGHQFMPFLTFAGGKLTVAWYDQRDSASVLASGVDNWVSDGHPHIRQTLDVRAAQADPGPLPAFEPSVQVSRYLWALFEDSYGKQYVQQVQFNPPNYPLFKGGTAPFLGDYIEVTPSPMFVRDEAGTWRFNTAPTSAPVFHVVWADNRDVRPPGPENYYDWTNYTPPASDQGDFGIQYCGSVNIPGMGMRNQNIYTSALTRGVIAAAPANSKPLGTGLGYYPGTGELVQRSFVIYVKNPVEVMKSFRLSIESQPAHGSASFLEFESLSSLDVVITAFSTIARTVFVRSPDERDTVTIRVAEIDWDGYLVPGGLTGEIVLNPDPTAPQIDPATDEVHNPNIRNSQIINWTEVPSPNIRNPNIVNPNVINALIVNPNVVNPNIVNPNIRNPNVVNPNIVNPNIRNPNIRNANIINPNIINPNIRNDSLEGAEIYDVTATVVNVGNTTTSYTLKTYAKEALPEDVYLQLLVYKTYYTPAADTDGESGSEACLLKVERHDELVLNIANPNIRNPNIVNPNIRNPNIRNESVENATFALAPGEEAEVMVRIIRPAETSQSAPVRSLKTTSLQNDFGVSQYFDIETFAESIGFAATAQAVNTEEAREEGVTTPPAAASKLIIGTGSLPDGVVGTWYSTTLEAYGGEEPYNWALNSGALPPGLTLESNGTIRGTPTAEGFYRFVVRVDDRGGDFDTQRFSIYIAADDVTPVPLAIVTTSLPGGVLDYWYGATLEAVGGVWPRTWSLVPGAGSLPPGLEMDSEGVISGIIRRDASLTYPATYTFSVRVADGAGETASRALSVTVNERTGANYTISGTVYDGSGNPLDGVVMRGLPNTPVTGASGYYQDTVPEFWSGTVIPNKEGYTFVPESRSYTDLASDWPYQDYHVGASPGLTISGRVTVGGSGLAGVEMSGLPVYMVTDAGGYYSAVVSPGWSGTVTPELAGYEFDPPSRTYSGIQVDQTAQHYAATLVPITTIPAAEREALIALYNATGGDNWTNRSGWKLPPLHTDGFAMPGTEGTWFGITVEGVHVTGIYLRWNELTGTIPIELGQLTHLRTLGLRSGQLTGPIPAVLGTLTQLQELALDFNQLGGTIPDTLGSLTNLRALSLQFNELSGTIPAVLGDLASLQWLDLSVNQLTGNIPTTLGNLNSLHWLQLRWNQLSGTIPAVLGNLTQLQDLYLDNNQLGGTIPDTLGLLTDLRVLSLQFNQLTGSIPTTLGNITNLSILALKGNQLSGTIPAVLGDLASLQRLDLSSNQLGGSIPANLGNLTNLVYLYLDWNQLTGHIPTELGSLTSLLFLGLEWNQLTGNIPEELGNLTSLQDLYLSSNQLDGSIPEELGNLTGLRDLRLYSNRLSGHIPTNLISLVNLAHLSISHNALYSQDAGLNAFLNDKSGDWWTTQTVAPTGVSAAGAGPDTVLVSWTPIPYTADGGGYRVYWRAAPQDPFELYGQTPDKTVSSLSVSGLATGQTYTFVVQTRTDPHGLNANTVDSEFSLEVTAAPLGQVLISGTVTLGDSGLAGVVMSGLPGEPVTGTDGYYSASVSTGWSGTVTPTLAGYTFDPPSRDYTDVTSDQTGQDYAATLLGGGVYFTVQPSDAQAGQPISPNVRVKILGDDGAPLPGISVTVSIENNAGGGSLSGGTSTVTNSSGDATFMDLSINAPGSGYTLRVTAALTGYGWSNYAISIPFNIL